MKQENSLWEKISGQVDLPDEVFPGQPLIEIVSDKRVLIEHHRGVCEYGRDKICIKASFGMIQICGSGLHLRCMTKQQLVVSGCIRSVTLLRRGQE